MSWFERKQKLPKGIQESLMPDRQFAERTKQQFLASFDFHQSSRPAGAVFLSKKGPSKMFLVWKTGGVVLATLGLIAATSAFADAQNVSPTNPLYPFKRLAESTELTFTSNTKKPMLELSFAARRAQEIRDLSAGSDVTSTAPLFTKLAGDFEADASTSLTVTAAAEQSPSSSFGTAPLASFCSAAGEAWSHLTMLFHPDFARRVMSTCGFSTSTAATIGTQITGSGSGSDSGSGSVHVAAPLHITAPAATTTTATATGSLSVPSVNVVVPSPEISPPSTSSGDGPSGTGSASAAAGVSIPAPVVTTPPVSVSVPGTGVSVSVPSLSL